MTNRTHLLQSGALCVAEGQQVSAQSEFGNTFGLRLTTTISHNRATLTSGARGRYPGTLRRFSPSRPGGCANAPHSPLARLASALQDRRRSLKHHLPDENRTGERADRDIKMDRRVNGHSIHKFDLITRACKLRTRVYVQI